VIAENRPADTLIRLRRGCQTLYLSISSLVLGAAGDCRLNIALIVYSPTVATRVRYRYVPPCSLACAQATNRLEFNRLVEMRNVDGCGARFDA
jgi:hypothetical protein